MTRSSDADPSEGDQSGSEGPQAPRRRGEASAAAKAAAIVAYFAVAAIWLPSAALTAGPVATASPTVRDLVGVGLWAMAMALGLVALRRAQQRGLI